MQNTDWRLALPEDRRRKVRAWFYSIAAVTLCVLIVGGITRLTFSGLSMVEWDPVMGIIPPITDAQWQASFEKYQQFPEFQKIRQGMTVHDYKVIFFWEYLHRLLARAIGMVFLIPFAFFMWKRWLNRPLALRALALFGLGAMQGVMGWLMVAGGLVDRPSVSHYRLAAHLSLAFIIFAYAVWLARELSIPARQNFVDPRAHRIIRRGLLGVGVLLGVQIVYGAFVAGLKAGFFANTFPLMGERLIPAGWLNLQPLLRNFVENGATVQWLHRVIGTILGFAVIALFARTRALPSDVWSKRYATLLVGVVALQYLLGVLTLINAVPVALGVTHQAVALLLWGCWVIWWHHSTTQSRALVQQSRSQSARGTEAGVR
jgi:cytochrome c oxidase assembly protein subunit 15